MKRKFLFLKKYKDKFEKEVERYIAFIGKDNELKKACAYTITSGGKRFRPIIVMLISEALGKNFDVLSSALSVELFHSASLIADDLPCMDDEKERRCKPALHLVFDESVALLVSYSFISAGYEMIEKNANILASQNKIDKSKANELCSIAIREVSKVSGVFGATNGQFLDLFPPDSSAETIFKIINQKTGTLFEISFILGWLFGGGDTDKIEEVKGIACNFGMAFQIADDINDLSQDIENGNEINIVRSLGEKKAKELFDLNLNDFRKKMDQLNILTSPFKQMCELLEKSIYKK